MPAGDSSPSEPEASPCPPPRAPDLDVCGCALDFSFVRSKRIPAGTGYGDTRRDRYSGRAMGVHGGKDARDVLVVDDEQSLRLLCRVNLELEGHRVREAASLAEARQEIERAIPDVILLDIHVGADDGLELLDEIEALDGP